MGRVPVVIGMSDSVTRVTKVRPAAERVLHVRFAGDRRHHKLDMTELIARSAHFAPLMDDAETFAKVVIVEDGLGVAWPVETAPCGRHYRGFQQGACRHGSLRTPRVVAPQARDPCL